MRLAGKVAVVTGGASGIGAATARLFAREGARLVVADIDAENGARLTDALAGERLFVAADVSASAQVAALMERAVEAFGRIDILFNNAAIVPAEGSLLELSEETFDRVIAVNMKGVWLGMKFAVPHMIAAGGGAIINNASIGGLLGGRGKTAYGAAKGAVLQMTRDAAAEFAGHGIRVNALCPGSILTPLSAARRPGLDEEEIARLFAARQPIPRPGRPEDIAGAALWLAGDEASFVTAQAIVVDGGLTGSRTYSEPA